MKAAIQATWQTELMARHPELFKQEFCGRVIKPGYPTVGDGWRDLVENAVARMAAAVAGVPGASLKVGQVKEKFGTLRVYFHNRRGRSNPVNAAIDEVIALAEARSACTCETCGNEGRLFKHGSWLHTACDEHSKGKQVPQKADLQNVHVVWTVTDGQRMLCAKRYVRETDKFEEVDPSTLNLDEG